MEQKLSNEERYKVFFLYYGSKYRYKNEFGTFADTISELNLRLKKHIDQGAQLELTPISEISDEHAIEVVKIVAGLYIKESPKDVPVKVAGRDADGVKVMVGYVSYKIFTTGDIIGAHEDIDEYVPVLNISQAIDFLRSKNYALPYKNIDLFEAGIAIKKETK